jgi:hypothetical protein
LIAAIPHRPLQPAMLWAPLVPEFHCASFALSRIAQIAGRPSGVTIASHPASFALPRIAGRRPLAYRKVAGVEAARHLLREPSIHETDPQLRAPRQDSYPVDPRERADRILDRAAVAIATIVAIHLF